MQHAKRELPSIPPTPQLTLGIDSQAVVMTGSNFVYVLGKIGLFSLIVITKSATAKGALLAAQNAFWRQHYKA